LLDRYQEREKDRIRHQELLMGILASTVANFSMGTPKKPLTPGDFMPSEMKNKPVKKKPVNRTLVAEQTRDFFQILAARQKKKHEGTNGKGE
jgi:hypothetical protein